MTNYTQNNQFLSEQYAPCKLEFFDETLSIHGEIPFNLSGTLYRNGPNPRFSPKGRHHLFDGHGMIHKFYFQNKQVTYSNRWVHTERYKIENRFQQDVFGGLLDFQGRPISFTTVDRAYNAANTNLIWHAGKLLAFWEFGTPYEINPQDLSTTGTWWLSSQYRGAFTPHPKKDYVTGDLIAISSNGCSTLPACTLSTISKDGIVLNQITIPTPYRSMIHDFVLTDNYIVFPLLPAELDFSGDSAQIVSWRPQLGAFIGILSRHSKSDKVLWFEIETCYIYHFVNAYEKDNTIIIDAIVHEHVPLFVYDTDGQLIQAQHADLIRFQLDINQKTVEKTILNNQIYFHFPHIDYRYSGKVYSQFYASADNEIKQHILIDYNLQTNQYSSYHHGSDWYIGEPILADDYILILAINKKEENSALLIFSAQDIPLGPIALIEIPQHISSGFHGCWVK